MAAVLSCRRVWEVYCLGLHVPYPDPTLHHYRCRHLQEVASMICWASPMTLIANVAIIHCIVAFPRSQ